MIHIYGNLISAPTNKVLYCANYLELPYEFHEIDMRASQQHSPEFLKINSLAKIPAITDGEFTLAESNAILRYFAYKLESPLYPSEIRERAVVDQWIDYATIHVGFAMGRIAFNTIFYKSCGVSKDERSLQDGHHFLNKYLPHVEQRLKDYFYIAGTILTLADFALFAALDGAEVVKVDLSPYPHIISWLEKLREEAFYQNHPTNYVQLLNEALKK